MMGVSGGDIFAPGFWARLLLSDARWSARRDGNALVINDDGGDSFVVAFDEIDDAKLRRGVFWSAALLQQASGCTTLNGLGHKAARRLKYEIDWRVGAILAKKLAGFSAVARDGGAAIDAFYAQQKELSRRDAEVFCESLAARYGAKLKDAEEILRHPLLKKNDIPNNLSVWNSRLKDISGVYAELDAHNKIFIRKSLLEKLAEFSVVVQKGIAAIGGFYAQQKYLSRRDAELFCKSLATRYGAQFEKGKEILRHPLLSENAAPPSLAVWDNRLRDVSGGYKELDSRNEEFMRSETVRYKSFFDAVEKTPLTEEQRRAAMVMEDRGLLVAAAGSGKTSAIVGKIGYALKANLCRPPQILALAFNTKAAAELRERIKNRLGNPASDGEVRAETFHAYGLSLVAESRGEKPRIAEWTQLIGGADGGEMESLMAQTAAQSSDFLSLLAHFRYEMKPFHQFKNRRDYEKYLIEIGVQQRAGEGVITINGERVRSMEELAIANWLYFNGVDYRYEGGYEYDTATVERAQYHPDFYYPATKLYHEHFALDKNGKPPSFIGDGYLAGVKWKRELHRKRGTKLIETTSAMFYDGTVFEHLHAELKKHGAMDGARRRNFAEIKSKLQSHFIRPLYKLMQTFLKHWKAGELSEEELSARVKELPPHRHGRAAAFLRVMIQFRKRYEEKLRDKKEIDFTDMLVESARAIESGKAGHDFRLILVDEFQDISRDRARLLKAMLNQNRDCKLFAVGDDWQAIYRFAGADISIMTDFAGEFGFAAEDRLTKTFRSNQGIADIAAKFVGQNPAQIKKTVVAADESRRGVAQIIYYRRDEDAETITENRLRELAAQNQSGEKIAVDILARYNHLRPKKLEQWRRCFNDAMEINFRTVHGAKGLEADYIFILGLREGRYGFPSAIADDPILDLVMPRKEKYEHAEERRLFYVALTRARRRVFLLARGDAPSRFVGEIVKDAGDEVKIAADDKGKIIAAQMCPKCGDGFLQERPGKHNDFWGCSTYPLCDYIKNIGHHCPQCATGVLRKIPGKYGGFWGCSNFNKRPNCNYKRAVSADAAAK